MALAGCAPAPAPVGINDPNEARNREIHAFNKRLDETTIRPIANAYGQIVPDPVRQGIGNFAENADLPGAVVNNLLQGNLEDAGWNTGRFLVNTVFGLGGLVDVSSQMGHPERETDFGETLHVWGVPEGPYREGLVFGPTTRRDSIGGFVDLFTNPLGYVIESPESYVPTAAGALEQLDDRYRYRTTIDGLLYDSADSYAAARLAYLQNRRFELGQEVNLGGDAPTDIGNLGDESFDPYALD
ncbi:MAG: MlaA family lipoprotein [Shimia sp.]